MFPWPFAVHNIVHAAIVLVEEAMDPSFVQWMVGQTGIGSLAAFSIWQLLQSKNEEIRREREAAVRQREDLDRLLQALGENTKAMTRVAEVIGSCPARWDRERSERRDP
jgi:hypothetical protein